MVLPSEVGAGLVETAGILTATLAFVATIHFTRTWGSSERLIFKCLEVLTTACIIGLGISAITVVNQSEFTLYYVVSDINTSDVLAAATLVLMAVSIAIMVLGLRMKG